MMVSVMVSVRVQVDALREWFRKYKTAEGKVKWVNIYCMGYNPVMCNIYNIFIIISFFCLLAGYVSCGDS